MVVPDIDSKLVRRYVYCMKIGGPRIMVWNTMIPIHDSKRSYLGFAFWPVDDSRPLFADRIETARGIAYDSIAVLVMVLDIVLNPALGRLTEHQRHWQESDQAVDLEKELAECTASNNFDSLFIDV